MSAGKIRGAFNDEQFEAFCQELMSLPVKQRTLEGIARFFEKRTGVKASREAAKTFKHGAFSRYVERLNASKETREELCAAAGAGVHPLDAIEEAMVIELQDHLTQAEGGEIDIGWVVSQLVKLRTSISMREESHRKQRDLERKLTETEKKLQLADNRIAQIVQNMELQRFDAVQAAIKHAKEIRTITADSKLSAKQKTERVRKILFGDQPKDWKPVTATGGETEGAK